MAYSCCVLKNVIFAHPQTSVIESSLYSISFLKFFSCKFERNVKRGCFYTSFEGDHIILCKYVTPRVLSFPATAPMNYDEIKDPGKCTISVSDPLKCADVFLTYSCIFGRDNFRNPHLTQMETFQGPMSEQADQIFPTVTNDEWWIFPAEAFLLFFLFLLILHLLILNFPV